MCQWSHQIPAQEQSNRHASADAGIFAAIGYFQDSVLQPWDGRACGRPVGYGNELQRL